jgi:outer membrane protein insertion porin family
MGRRRDARFISSGVKVPPAASASVPSPDPAPAPVLLSAALPFAHIGRAIDAAVGRGREVLASSGIKLPSAASSPSPALTHPFADIARAVDAAARRLGSCLPRIPVARADTAPPLPRRHGKDGGGGEERVLISEVVVRGKDGEPLERPELEEAAAAALRACRPNAALTVREVQDDVHRVVESGLFRSCMPVAVDTRDGIRLVFEVLLSSCSPLLSTALLLELKYAIFRLCDLLGGAEPGFPRVGLRGRQHAAFQVPGRCVS